MPVTINGSTGIGTPGVASTGAVSGTTGTFTGNVSGADGAFSGNVTANGVATELRPLVLMTAKAWDWNGLSTNTVLEFTGIPSWAKRATVMLDRISLSGTDNILVQLGTSGGYVATGYTGSSTSVSSTAGMIIGAATASREITGLMTICLLTGTRWVSDHSVTYVSNVFSGGSTVDVGGVLDRLRLTVTTTNTFDGGTANVMYE
jgi:hypothetical protein